MTEPLGVTTEELMQIAVDLAGQTRSVGYGSTSS